MLHRGNDTVRQVGIIEKLLGPRLEWFVKEALFRATYHVYLHGRALLTFLRLQRAAPVSIEGQQRDAAAEQSLGPTNMLNVYRAPQHPLWRDAWKITEKLLLRFRESVERDGGRFVLVIIPYGPDDVLYGGENEAAKKTRRFFDAHGLDVAYPANRLRDFSQRHGIAFLSLIPGFQSYQRQHGLKFPYFGQSCDAHWSPLGHEVAADLIGAYLVENKLIPLSTHGLAQKSE